MNKSAAKPREQGGGKMTCAEFQKLLPQLYESGNTAEGHDHLQGCETCSDLVADLNYIAEQAKLLLPMRDPSPQVWNKIQNSLEREGLIKPDPNQNSAKKKPLTDTR
jgi:hypothetical protein